jgi:hypothetical protein
MLRPRLGNIADEPLEARPRIGLKFDILMSALGGALGHRKKTIRVNAKSFHGVWLNHTPICAARVPDAVPYEHGH